MENPNKIITAKSRAIGPGEPIFLTAEIGSAHEGDFERCKHLMRVAKAAGCDGTDVFWIDPALAYEGANLRMIDTYRKAFADRGVLAGCVEHTTSKWLIYAVAALQPALISKHLMLKHDDQVADSNISFEAGEMKAIVRNVRRVEQAMGQGSNFTICQKDGTLTFDNIWQRKVLVCAHDIATGETLSRDDFMAKRPGSLGGLHPWYGELLHGATAKVDMPKNTRVDLNMVKNIPPPEYRPYPLARRCYDGNYLGP